MLNDTDVADLKAQVATLTSTGSTNYEDGLVRMFMNSDGSTQQMLPDTLIFFTDGVPNYSRLNATTAAFPATMDPDDIGLPTSGGSSYNQMGWNRANRIARQFDVDVDRFIGVLVGADATGSSTWLTQGAGYHLENYLKGYHLLYERGLHLTNYVKGYHLTYERAGNGINYEKLVGSTWGTSNGFNQSKYDSLNTVPGESDGYRARVSNPANLSNWGTVTKALYDKSNITPGSDQSDGYRETKVYSTPFDTWEPTTQALYDTNNNATLAYTVTTDGWGATAAYSSPYTLWETSTQAAYTAGNNAALGPANSTDGWRQTNVYTTPFNTWETTTAAAYAAGNTAWGAADGWDATKVYAQPYDFHENTTSTTVTNATVLSRIVTVGTPVPASPVGGPYTNAAVADMYVLPDWAQFTGALTSVALAECGGTVTLQTRVGGVAAADPFTYQNSQDKTIATTSQQYRSGTFDFDLPNGQPITVDITPVNLSNLSKYDHVSWTCKSAGADYPFTATTIAGTNWKKITLTVSPNQAISCIQTVKLA
jgi:hypothetical protein